jgi:hypothetical protein
MMHDMTGRHRMHYVFEVEDAFEMHKYAVVANTGELRNKIKKR